MRPAVTQAAVQLQLANEKAAELENGERSEIVYDLPSPSMMIMVKWSSRSNNIAFDEMSLALEPIAQICNVPRLSSSKMHFSAR
ncbi:hypothetical protein SCP_0504560 [Sparassis crispa]|uniref:Uncharacterized protein n=1 Tax=Sparassis crispa TaxID=139825 RepID=A0A401GMH4_9APHY|nr:hypothetical protein SCP_0504560 [Sparassis crispa]GBE83408.1 hypothetical protein SCP_0504560 [Sparassis crispa]